MLGWVLESSCCPRTKARFDDYFSYVSREETRERKIRKEKKETDKKRFRHWRGKSVSSLVGSVNHKARFLEGTLLVKYDRSNHLPAGQPFVAMAVCDIIALKDSGLSGCTEGGSPHAVQYGVLVRALPTPKIMFRMKSPARCATPTPGHSGADIPERAIQFREEAALAGGQTSGSRVLTDTEAHLATSWSCGPNMYGLVLSLVPPPVPKSWIWSREVPAATEPLA